MALDVYIIPFSNKEESFVCSLSGISLRFENFWNDAAQLWFIDVYNATTNEAITLGLPLVTGCDLLAQFKYKGLAGHIFCHNEGATDEPPTFENLGETCFVYFTPLDIPAFEGF